MAWKLATAYVEVVGELSRFRRDLTGAQQRIRRFGASAARIAVGTAAAIAMISLPVARVVKDFAQFDRQLSMVSTMLDEQGMRLLPRYRQQLRAMSKDLGEVTDTLAKGLYDILSASIAPEKALRVLAVTSRAAKAGFSDTATATDAVTSILNAYGMEAQEAARVSDVLFATVKRGKLTFGELASTIGTVASTANMAGVALEEVTAFIATTTRAGIRAHEAVTSLNAVLRAFLSPTTEAKRKARELGFELSTNTLKTRGLLEVMRLLQHAQAEELAIIFPRIRGLKGVAAATGDLTGLTKDLGLMYTSAGASMEAFGKVAKDTQTQLEKSSAAWRDLKVAMGEALAPGMIRRLEAMTWMYGGGAKAFRDAAKAADDEGVLLARRAELQAEMERLGARVRGPWYVGLPAGYTKIADEYHDIIRQLNAIDQKRTLAFAKQQWEDVAIAEEAFGEREALWAEGFRAEQKLAHDRILLNGQTLAEMTTEAKRYTEMWKDEGLERYYSDVDILERYQKDMKRFAKEIKKEIMGTIEAGATMIKGVEAARLRGGFGQVAGRMGMAKVEDQQVRQAVKNVEVAVKALPTAIAKEIGALPGAGVWGGP